MPLTGRLRIVVVLSAFAAALPALTAMGAASPQASVVQAGQIAPVPPGRSDDAAGITAAVAAMRELEPLVGAFTLDAGERGTDGSSFRETGARDCRWIWDRAAIFCEDRRTLTEASGRYVTLHQHRRPTFIFRWHPGERAFQRIDIGLAGTPGVQTMTRQQDRTTFSWAFTVAASSFNQEPLTATSELIVEPERHVIRQELRSTVSAFAESYAETATRAPAAGHLLEGEWETDGSSPVRFVMVVRRGRR